MAYTRKEFPLVGEPLYSDLFDMALLSLDVKRWSVCWFGETEDGGWVQGKGDPLDLPEANRRRKWGRETYPHMFYWLEPS